MDKMIIISAVSIGIFMVLSLIQEYFRKKEMNKLVEDFLSIRNQLDALERRVSIEYDNTNGRLRHFQSHLDGVKDTLKYDYMTTKTAYCMYDMHNLRLISLTDSLEGYRSILARLEPLAPLADKFDVKRRMLYNKDYMADLKEELKEIEDELKGIA